MDTKYIVMLKTPLDESHSATVALHLAEKLNVSISKMTRLLSSHPGPLTKPVNKEIADKLARLMRQLEIDVEVLPDTPEPLLDLKAEPAPQRPLKNGADEVRQVLENLPSSSRRAPLPPPEAKPSLKTRLPILLIGLLLLGVLAVLGTNFLVPQLAGRSEDRSGAGLLEAAAVSDAATVPLLAEPAQHSVVEEASQRSGQNLAYWQEKAQAGDSEAQFELAWHYTNGIDTEQSYAEAAKWLKQAATQNHPEAQYHLGLYYLYGHGVNKDLSEAARLLTAAAKQGVGEAQHRLGLMYLSGEGVTADPAQAVIWLQAAQGLGIEDVSESLEEALAASEEVLSQADQQQLLIEAPPLNANAADLPNPFTVARFGAPQEIIEAVLQGLDVNTRDADGQTPLMYAAGKNSPEAVRELISGGAEVNAQSSSGWTALMFAARDNPVVLGILIEEGAITSMVNNEGKTAFDIALEHHPDVAPLLLDSTD